MTINVAMFYKGIFGFLTDQMKLSSLADIANGSLNGTCFVWFCLFWLLFVECEMLKQQISDGTFVPRSPGPRTNLHKGHHRGDVLASPPLLG